MLLFLLRDMKALSDSVSYHDIPVNMDRKVHRIEFLARLYAENGDPVLEDDVSREDMHHKDVGQAGGETLLDFLLLSLPLADSAGKKAIGLEKFSCNRSPAFLPPPVLCHRATTTKRINHSCSQPPFYTKHTCVVCTHMHKLGES